MIKNIYAKENIDFFQRSMIQKFQNKQPPNLNMLFLNLYIRRAHLVVDSLAEVCSIYNLIDKFYFFEKGYKKT